MSNNIRDISLLINFGLKVKELRLKKGLTQEQLAYESEVELSQIHRIEAGKTNLTFSTLKITKNTRFPYLLHSFGDALFQPVIQGVFLPYYD